MSFKNVVFLDFDSSTGMGYLQIQNQHKKLGHDSENRISVQGTDFLT